MKTLAEIYEGYKSPASWGDKGTVHSYIEVYEQVLAPYRQTAQKVLEIGILSGQSLRMWEDYFHTAQVHGIDSCDRPLNMCDLRPMIAEGTHHISLLNACDPEHVEKHFPGVLFDVIVEDASHVFEDQLAIYANFKTHISPHGIYIIEDVQDLDRHFEAFKQIDPSKPVRIIDRRKVKSRYDDVLIIIGGNP